MRHAADELIQRRGRRFPFVGRNGRPGRDVDAFVSSIGVDLGDRTAKADERVAPRRIVRENPLQHGDAFDMRPSRSSISASVHSSSGSDPATSSRQQRPRAVDVAARHEQLRELRADALVRRIGVDRASQDVDALVVPALPQQLLRDALQLGRARRELAGGFEIAARRIGLHQQPPQIGVLRIDLRSFGQQPQRVGRPALLLQVGGDKL